MLFYHKNLSAGSLDHHIEYVSLSALDLVFHEFLLVILIVHVFFLLTVIQNSFICFSCAFSGKNCVIMLFLFCGRRRWIRGSLVQNTSCSWLLLLFGVAHLM
jgi:hypothetical protein